MISSRLLSSHQNITSTALSKILSSANKALTSSSSSSQQQRSLYENVSMNNNNDQINSTTTTRQQYQFKRQRSWLLQESNTNSTKSSSYVTYNNSNPFSTYFIQQNNHQSSSLSSCQYSKSSSSPPVQIGQPTHETHPHLLAKGEVIKGVQLQEFKDRRKRFISAFADGSIVILFTPPEPMMSYDIPFSFRQNTNFFYYTGFNEPEGILVMEKISDNLHTETMFVREKIPEKELWEGPRCGPSNAVSKFGVNNAYTLDELHILNDIIRKSSSRGIFINSVRWDNLKIDYNNKTLYDVEPYLQMSRLVKSESEIKMMMESGSIAGQSFKDTMKFVKPGMNEYQASAFFEFSVKNRGAQRMSYPPVVAGGNNANTLHYISNNMLLKSGDLLLMDAGCEFWGFTSDITRTFPVNGKFTDAQKHLYEAVLDVNKKCIEMCRAGQTINTIHRYSVELIIGHLLRLGILDREPGTTSSAPITKQEIEDHVRLGKYHKFYPHSIGHYLGMDTHDTMSIPYGEILKPGMIITIEPGIYINEYDHEVSEQWRGINIRVEDDVAITQDDPINLTIDAPKEVDQIEYIMNSDN
ncbi:peptidase M24 family protein [Cavenderia fasciculata]|uniref:Peptidase M24 family protein n=1 Tax=Cavenderia fasciculata TaxID=261658 RepID=F4PV42_CACFS|nr:peptidase M24 family protein [Cavenderia fasciculata]EGG21158.1 peptidase M24 family protein [Cavenderia fasciculata]|eukprot:XP_004359008.1 peptidase M24 family protein [Cavenderia fasciculata]